MARVHITRQGESLGSIARANGFLSHQALYEHAANQELKRRRPDPNLLEPGDPVAIPDATPRELERATGQWHEETLDVEEPLLRLKLLDLERKPLPNQAYELSLDGEIRSGVTDGNGLLEEPIEYGTRTAELRTTVQLGEEPRELVWRLVLDGVDPKGTVKGLQGRMKNLGYYYGAIDGCLGPFTRAAVASFQAAAGLAVTGDANEETWDALERQHDQSG